MCRQELMKHPVQVEDHSSKCHASSHRCVFPSIQSSQGANLWEVDLASIIEVMITQIFFPQTAVGLKIAHI